MSNLIVNVNNPYDVIYEQGCLDRAGSIIADKLVFSRAFILTDRNVGPIYLERLEQSFKNEGKEVFSYKMDCGDTSKNLESYGFIIDKMVEIGIRKDDLIVALGGGVVGDMAGFISSSYMRGLNLIQIPTSFLAQIDSSIGGKTGLNTAFCKNVIGTISQPKLVLVDVDLIKTLPRKEVINGMGEAIKYAVLMGGESLGIIEKGLGGGNIERFIQLCGQYKSSLVEADEYDRGKRRLLNLGHTIGHAIETASDYSISHGLAVAKGIKFMMDVALKKGSIKETDYNRLISIFNKYGIDTSIDYDANELYKFVLLDKKGREGKISYIEILALGYCRISTIELESFKEMLDETLSNKN